MKLMYEADLEKLINNMPEVFRKLWESGKVIKVKIIREKPLKRYGDEINIHIWKDMILYADLEENISDIAERILSYFLYGEKAPIYVRKYTGKYADYCGADFGIRYAIA